MSIARRVARGASALMVGQVLRLASKGLVILLLTRVFLDPDEYGLLFFALSVLGVAALFASLGFAKAAGRYLAEYRETDPTQIPHILSAAVGYNVVTATAVAAALVVLRGRIATLLGQPELSPFLLVGAVYVVARSFQKGASLLFQGFNRVDLSAAVGIMANVSLFGAIVAFLVFGFGALGALYGYTLGYTLAAVVGFALLYARFYRRNRGGGPVEPGLRRRILEYSIPLTATRGANVLDSKIDTVLVGYFLNPAAVAYYTVGKQVTDFLIAPATSLGFAVSPTYGEQKADDNLARAARIYETTFEYTLALYVPAAAGVFLVAEPTIRLIFGDGYLGAVPVLQTFSVFVLIRAIDKITNDGLDYLGRARARAIAKGTTSAGNFLLNLVLIPALGVVGAAIATVITHSLMVAVELVIVYRELGPSPRRLARTASLVGLITTGMAIVVVPLTGYISGIPSLIAVVAAGIAVWAALATVSGVVDIGQLRSAFT